MRRRSAAILVLILLAVPAAGVVDARVPPPEGRPGFVPVPPADDGQGSPGGPMPAIVWRPSRAIGLPWWGRLSRGVLLPAEGPDWFTWDPVLNRKPDRPWRRYGTDALVRTVLHVVREYRAANPDVPRVGIGDLSRPRGGPFGRAYGGLGHASHQNGLDVDVWYPRLDGLERRPMRPSQVDRALAQDLVDRFADAGAEVIYVGPSLRLRGPRRVVRLLAHHDDHLHIRIPQPPE
jgi:murein endopeptidase